MSSKNTRSGGKFSGSHTTVIPAAAIVADIVSSQPEVNKIALGFIKAGLHSVSGHRRVKISERNGVLLLSVRDNTTHQELIVYTGDMQATKLAIARGARKRNLNIAFGNKNK